MFTKESLSYRANSKAGKPTELLTFQGDGSSILEKAGRISETCFQQGVESFCTGLWRLQVHAIL